MDTGHVKHNAERRQFEVEMDGRKAFLSYERSPGTLSLTHTEVPAAFRGRGIAAALTQAALEYARDNGLKVVPLCSYAEEYLARHPEYGDLVQA